MGFILLVEYTYSNHLKDKDGNENKLLSSHPAFALHADVSASHVARRPIHHCRVVSIVEVLSSWDAVQLTWIGC